MQLKDTIGLFMVFKQTKNTSLLWVYNLSASLHSDAVIILSKQFLSECIKSVVNFYVKLYLFSNVVFILFCCYILYYVSTIDCPLTISFS